MNTKTFPSTPPDWVRQLGALPRDEFFASVTSEGVSLTYNDARLASGASAILPRDADVTSSFSRRIPLRIPIVSSAMDTVTESAMATEIALLGGLGIVHKNMAIDDQARHVARVKHAVHGAIKTPITVRVDELVCDVLAACEQKGRKFRTFPVVSASGALVGLVTGQDFELAPRDPNLKIGEIMSRDLTTVDATVDRQAALAKMRESKKKVLPITGDQDALLGLYLFSDLRRVLEGSGDANLDANGQLYVGAAIGVSGDTFDRAAAVLEAGANVLVLDTAHGDTRAMVETVASLRSRFPDVDLVAGNVSEPESAWRLAEAGVDAVKVGQGPGSICTTRKVAGIGQPQLSAVWACAKAVSNHPNVRVIADGGIAHPGDITLALAAGAHSVMIGQMLAGTDEAPGDTVTIKGVKYKKYRGMGSIGAMKVNAERYGQAGVPSGKLVAEGVEALVPWTGPLADKLNELVGGLRAGMGYTGSRSIAELTANARFHRMTSAGDAESKPHDLAVVTS